MSEQAPADREKLAAIVGLAQNFLGDTTPRPGICYRPITIPLSWLFGKNSEPIVIGYKYEPPKRSYLDYWTKDELTGTEAQVKVAELHKLGLLRSRTAKFPVGGWSGHLGVTELQPARLVRRKVVPASSEKIYVISIDQFDGYDDKSFPYEQMIISDSTGLLEYDPAPALKKGLEAGTVTHSFGSGENASAMTTIYESDPLTRAELYLTGIEPDERTSTYGQ